MASLSLTHDAAGAANTDPKDVSAWHTLVKRTATLLRAAEPYGQSAVLLALRLVYGGLFARTGWGKLMNFERTRGFFESLGLPTPAFMVALVATTELVGGIVLVLGAGTRFAAAALTGVMVTAFATAHAAEAFQSLSAFTEQAPYPFLVATLVLLAFGAGRLSVDGWLRARASRNQRGASSEAAD
jgi:putative oxidoreductase